MELEVSSHFKNCLNLFLLQLVSFAFVVSSCLSLSWFSPTSTFSLSQSTCSLSGTPSSMSSPPRVKTTALTHNEEYCPVAIFNPLTGVKLCNAFREVCRRRAAHEEICVGAKKALEQTHEVKRKATEIQEDVALHRERTRRITNEHATSMTELDPWMKPCKLRPELHIA